MIGILFFLGCFLGCQDKRYLSGEFAKVMYKQRKNAKQISKHVCIPGLALGLFGYMVSNQGAKKLLKLIPKIHQHIDLDIHSKSLNGELNIYSIQPELVRHNFDYDTTIGVRHPVVLNKLLNNIKLDDKNMPLGWALSEANIEYLNYPLRYLSILYVIAGILLGLFRVSWYWSLLAFLSIQVPDYFYSKDHYRVTILLAGDMIFFLSAYLVGYFIRRIL